MTAADVGAQLINLEKEKLRRYDDAAAKNEDPDTQFFTSLTSDFKNLSRIAKMRCKIEIQEVILKYMTQAD